MNNLCCLINWIRRCDKCGWVICEDCWNMTYQRGRSVRGTCCGNVLVRLTYELYRVYGFTDTDGNWHSAEEYDK